ncbi:U-box domain-containing protein 30-like [Andrographis paniculata]|uniref:U-box domain-containing protein 30-like n=1 Tax=Andrographis paniculata TaxID=175694 RepID=UPI0021E8D2F3|nr:U-box domain-containing protein 30-like [Andrographis paniculata]
MPMFRPSKKEGILGFEGGGDGRILDLDTAVKDGVLGGVSNGGYGGGFGDKLDLKKMIEELNLHEVPSVFICPISLEPMQDPVTLCTGQTYEKFNILKWFSLGHYTCPTTMQELWDDTTTPNTTLYQLIYTWFSQKYVQMKKRSEDAQGVAMELLGTLKKVKGQARIQTLKELKQLVTNHSTARKAVVDEGGVALLSSLLGPFTSYAVGSEVIAILVNLILSSESRTNLMQPAKVSSIVDILNEGSLETKVNCIRLIQTLMEGKDFRTEIVSSHILLVALLRLVRDRRHPNGHLPGLGLLKLISMHKQVRSLIVSIGAVPQLVELIPILNPECVELALFILDMLSSEPEGRQALKDCPNAIPNAVKLLMRISESCTEYALSILWSVCKVSPEECSLIAVDAGLAAKLLLVLQSGYRPMLKQRAAELLKLCSLNYSDTIFISKCKLTRTMQ